jgi:hypothetical protein
MTITIDSNLEKEINSLSKDLHKKTNEIFKEAILLYKEKVSKQKEYDEIIKFSGIADGDSENRSSKELKELHSKRYE